jgi:hypothetical protein
MAGDVQSRCMATGAAALAQIHRTRGTDHRHTVLMARRRIFFGSDRSRDAIVNVTAARGMTLILEPEDDRG